jgi:hypothetical protein
MSAAVDRMQTCKLCMCSWNAVHHTCVCTKPFCPTVVGLQSLGGVLEAAGLRAAASMPSHKRRWPPACCERCSHQSFEEGVLINLLLCVLVGARTCACAASTPYHHPLHLRTYQHTPTLVS